MSMGRVPPDEGDWHVVKDSRGNDEIVTDEELEATSEWYDRNYGEFSDYGRDHRFPRGWFVVLMVPASLILLGVSLWIVL